MRTPFAAATFLGLLFAAPTAEARPGDLRIVLEPGIATFQQAQNQRSWGGLGGINVGVGISDLMWLQAHADRKIFPSGDGDIAAAAFSATLVYNIDLLPVTPFFEGGLSFVALSYLDLNRAITAPELPDELVPVLGVGLDWQVLDFLVVGAVFRYFPLLGSDALDEPAYTVINLRLGLVVDWGRSARKR